MSSIDRAGGFDDADSGNPGPHLPAKPLNPIFLEPISPYRAAINRQPAIRAELLARARALAHDPDYPPVSVMHQIACQILAAPDLSEEP